MDMSDPVWTLTGGRILRDGMPQSTTVVLEELDRDSGAALRRDVPEIRFSPAALTCRLRISGRFPREIKVATGLLKNGRFVGSDLDRDQSVVGATWHPIEPLSREQVIETLDRNQVSAGAIRVGKYFQLSCDSD